MLVSCQALSGYRAVGLSGCRALSGMSGLSGLVRAVGAVGVLSGAVQGTSYIVREMATWSKFLVLTMDQEFSLPRTRHNSATAVDCGARRYIGIDSKVVRCGHYKRPGLEPWLATWRPLATTSDQLATHWRLTGDMATWRLGDLATYWRPTGDHWQPLATRHYAHALATAGDHWQPGDLATWRPLATTGDLATWRPLATAGNCW